MQAIDLAVARAGKEIRGGLLSVVDLVEACLTRIASVDPAIRAWAVVDAEGARRTARALQAEADQRRLRGPLHGIPIGIKDNFWTAGLPTEAGSRVLAGFIPTEDASVVARLKAAGAIVLGKTHMSEFGFSEPPPTRNPWGSGHTPGGSSSGSAAAVATGMCPAAIGSQTGGSVSRPAAYCGIVGLKPGHGRISTYGLIPISPVMDHVGILARTVEDAVLVLGAVAGHDPRDPYSRVDAAEVHVARLGETQPPRLGLLRQDFFGFADAEMQAHIEEVSSRLASAGAIVEEVRLGADFRSIWSNLTAVMKSDAAAYHRTFEPQRDAYQASSKEFLDGGAAVDQSQYEEALTYRQRIAEELTTKYMGRFDGFITPGARGEAPTDASGTGDSVMSSPWSFLGLPTVVLPTGLSRHGLPLGMQLVGFAAREPELWATARWCEEAAGAKLTPPDPA